MVTLQILVLSFLVRIQVAQLKRLSSRVVFFVGGVGIIHEASGKPTANDEQGA